MLLAFVDLCRSKVSIDRKVLPVDIEICVFVGIFGLLACFYAACTFRWSLNLIKMIDCFVSWLLSAYSTGASRDESRASDFNLQTLNLVGVVEESARLFLRCTLALGCRLINFDHKLNANTLKLTRFA